MQEYRGYLIYGVDIGSDDIPEAVLEAVNNDEDCPARLFGYGFDGTGTIVGIEDTEQSADVHAAEPASFEIDAAQAAAFASWCAEHGVDGKPGWLIAASVG